ncbi:pilus assembly PilX family protein [Shewanella sp.]|uniref:pilus assembly PilX family protein n=1 Tax=Shewanella sp. TaxID=50422 RepID=UPI003F37CA7D
MLSKQQGAVLAIGLIFLLIITLIGVAGAGHSLLGERMASNNKQISEAFMAAETGLVNAVAWLDNPANAANWGQVSASQAAINATAISSGSGNKARWQIKSLAFNGKEATIESCGTINSSGVSRCILSTYIKGSGGGNLAAMNIIGNIGTFNVAKSNQFKLIGGDDGPALATNTEANKVKITTAIEASNRMGNYVGGIKQVEFDDPFGDPKKMNEFIEGIKEQWNAMLPTDPKKGNAPNNMGTPDSPRITYYEGNLAVSGAGPKGAGILVIKGNLEINGNFLDYDGLIIVTGQSFILKGGGQQDGKGAIVFANPIQIGDTWAFGQTVADFKFDISGGGNASFTYDKQALINARALLGDKYKAKELWQIDASASGGATTSKVSNWKATTQ